MARVLLAHTAVQTASDPVARRWSSTNLVGLPPGLLGSKAIKWNFTKFLVDRQGQVVERYAPNDKPEAIAADVEKLL